VSSPWRDALIFLQNFGWRDVLDIAVVALLLYQLLKLIRGTQAAQLLVGLGVIVAVGLAAEALNLRLLQFIFRNGGQAIVIAAVILFQPELRRALD
jgi:diadenylate cyclase